MGKLTFGLAIVGLAACGSNNTTPTDAPTKLIDAAADAKNFMDAPPSMYDLSCYQNAAPSPNAATLTVAGIYTETTLSGMNVTMTPISGGSVKIFQANSATQVGSTLTTDSNGDFTSAAIASVSPVDVSISATKSGETPVNLYPPSPLVANAAGLPVTTVSTTNLGLLEEFGAMVTQDPTKGILAVAVIDCASTPMNITGATVTIEQGGNAVTGDTPIQSAMFGGELYFNVPAGLTNVSATYNNMTFRAHDVTVVAAQLTATAVKPGY